MTDPKRIFVRVSFGSSYWRDTWPSFGEVMKDVLKIIKEHGLVSAYALDDSSMLVAVDKWDKRALIVFDVFHNEYDPVNAHLPRQNDLPVIVVNLSKHHASIAGGPIANKINEEIRSLHDLHGLQSRAPFYVDHSDGKVPSYPNPRSCTHRITQTHES